MSATTTARRGRARGARLTPDKLAELMAAGPAALVDVRVTPELAKALLAFNSHNRPLRPSRVRAFVDILATDRWVNTGEPVILTRETLNEGQHRLSAIAESGIEALMDLRFGIADNAFEVTGTGATRTPGDTLAILGVPSATGTAATLKLLIAYDKGIPKNSALRWRVGGDEIVGAYRRWPNTPEAVRMVQNRMGTSGQNGLYSGAICAGTFLALTAANEAPVAQFLDVLASGLTRDAHDPPRLLRERLMRDPVLRNGTRESSTRKFALFIEAWNAWRGGDRPRELGWKYGMEFPKVEGARL